jgi:hypothetical protein
MITIDDIAYSFDETKSEIENPPGLPLVFVIDGECLYDFFSNKYGAELFMKNNGIVDVSSEYPDYEGITVKIIIDENNFEIFQTSEYLGSILLTTSKALCLWDYPYGIYVQSPYATFDGEKFTLLNQDMNNLQPYPHEPPTTSFKFFA